MSSYFGTNVEEVQDIDRFVQDFTYDQGTNKTKLRINEIEFIDDPIPPISGNSNIMYMTNGVLNFDGSFLIDAIGEAAVTSVNGLTGSVVLSTANVAPVGDSLYVSSSQKTQIGTNQTNITSLQGNINLLHPQVQLIDSNVDILQANVSVLQGNITSLNSRVLSLEGNTATLTGNVNTLFSVVNELTGNSTAIFDQVQFIDANVSILQGEVDLLQGNIFLTRTGNVINLPLPNDDLFTIGTVNNPTLKLEIGSDINVRGNIFNNGVLTRQPVLIKGTNTYGSTSFFPENDATYTTSFADELGNCVITKAPTNQTIYLHFTNNKNATNCMFVSDFPRAVSQIEGFHDNDSNVEVRFRNLNDDDILPNFKCISF
jgi:hypothetical protein